MKRYNTLELEISELDFSDVISTSDVTIGTGPGIWNQNTVNEMNIGNENSYQIGIPD